MFDSWDPKDCSPPGSSVHGILQARILEWVPISFSRGSSPPSDQIRISLLHLLHWQADCLPLSHQGSPDLFSQVYKCMHAAAAIAAKSCQSCPTTTLLRTGDEDAEQLGVYPPWYPLHPFSLCADLVVFSVSETRHVIQRFLGYKQRLLLFQLESKDTCSFKSHFMS